MVCYSTLLPSSTHFTRALVTHSLKLLEFLPSCCTLLDILLSLPLAEGVSSSAQCKGVSILLSHFFSLLKRGSAFLMESEYLAVVTGMGGSSQGHNCTCLRLMMEWNMFMMGASTFIFVSLFLWDGGATWLASWHAE